MFLLPLNIFQTPLPLVSHSSVLVPNLCPFWVPPSSPLGPTLPSSESFLIYSLYFLFASWVLPPSLLGPFPFSPESNALSVRFWVPPASPLGLTLFSPEPCLSSPGSFLLYYVLFITALHYCWMDHPAQINFTLPCPLLAWDPPSSLLLSSGILPSSFGAPSLFSLGSYPLHSWVPASSPLAPAFLSTWSHPLH